MEDTLRKVTGIALLVVILFAAISLLGGCARSRTVYPDGRIVEHEELDPVLVELVTEYLDALKAEREAETLADRLEASERAELLKEALALLRESRGNAPE